MTLSTVPNAEGLSPKIAILIPCYNEEATIATVVRDFKLNLPNAKIYVYDNNSTDRTIELATKAQAIVCQELRRGKGNVVRRMFADVDADIYVLVDGDATYDAQAAPSLIRHLVDQNLDMVVGARESQDSAAYRLGHEWGNKVITRMVEIIFGQQFTDILSGYRVFSKRFVKSFPALSTGFEIETEITAHALQMKMPLGEIMTAYGARPEGSASKLSTYKDGFRIGLKILALLKAFRPFALFGSLSLVFVIIAALIFLPILLTYYHTGLVPRFPSLIFAMGLLMISFLCLVCGVILDDVKNGRIEKKRLAYLAYLPVKNQ